MRRALSVLSDRLSEQVRTLALSSTSRRRVGCVLLRKSRVVVSSVNMEGKTHPLQKSFSIRAGQPFRKSLHAEIRALIKCRGACDALVVGRVNKKGQLCMAMPCPVCQLAISESGIKDIIYSDLKGEWCRLELPT